MALINTNMGVYKSTTFTTSLTEVLKYMCVAKPGNQKS